jgi:HAD superfamily hydrolase (TIGR01509 family)
MSIKAIGFDFGGVLALHKSVMPEISATIQIPLEEIRKSYFQKNRLANVGDMSYEDLWLMILKEFSKEEYFNEVKRLLEINATVDLNRPVIELAERLLENGYKIGLFSNNTSANGNLMRDEGLDKLFEVFLISAEVGHQKPEAEAYQLLADKLEVSLNELVFIDDSPTSLVDAEEVGYTPILFESYEQLVADLRKLNIKGV